MANLGLSVSVEECLNLKYNKGYGGSLIFPLDLFFIVLSLYKETYGAVRDKLSMRHRTEYTEAMS